LYVVATPIGNLEDVTLRALRVLREVRLIAAEDTRRTAKLLAHAGIGTPMTSLHAHNERDRVASLLHRMAEGQAIALVTDAGTPLLSDPGALLVRSALDAGVPVEPIPGPSAITTSLMMTGEGSDGFTFLGFPPVRSKDRLRWFLSVSSFPHPVVFFEAPHRILKTLADLATHVGEARQAAICREMTKIHEQLIRGDIKTLAQHPDVVAAVGEFTVVLMPEGEATDPMETTDADVWLEFCGMTEEGGLRRREAIAVVARRLGLSTRAAYAAVERHRSQAQVEHEP
jgi:16S rRNA (cytidine1402-2'-O)-methyltransferase